MKVYHLVVQRNCSYEGQFAPEVFATADEWTQDDNPRYLNEKIAEVVSYLGPDKDFASYGIVVTNLNDDLVDQALNNWVEEDE